MAKSLHPESFKWSNPLLRIHLDGQIPAPGSFKWLNPAFKWPNLCLRSHINGQITAFQWSNPSFKWANPSLKWPKPCSPCYFTSFKWPKSGFQRYFTSFKWPKSGFQRYLPSFKCFPGHFCFICRWSALVDSSFVGDWFLFTHKIRVMWTNDFYLSTKLENLPDLPSWFP